MVSDGINRFDLRWIAAGHPVRPVARYATRSLTACVANCWADAAAALRPARSVNDAR